MVGPLGFELRTFGSEEVGNIDLKAYREYLMKNTAIPQYPLPSHFIYRSINWAFNSV